MAQRAKRSGTRSVRAFASRMGLGGRGPALVCAALLAVAFAVVGVMRLRAGSFEVQRGVTGDSSVRAEALAETSTSNAEMPEGGASSGDAGNPTDEERLAELVVHVDGAVVSPGVYRIGIPDARVADVVEMAGGLADNADTVRVNLAAPLVDGAKVHIPKEGEDDQVVDGGAAPREEGLASGGLVNVNTANIDELQTLSGIGQATAQAIVDERESAGPFTSVDDLLRVTGIGEKKLARIREHVCV